MEADGVHCTWIVKWNVIERLNGVENDAELFYSAEARQWQWNYLNHESISSLTRNSIALSSTTLSFCVWIAMHADISRRSFVTFSPHDVEIFPLLSLFLFANFLPFSVDRSSMNFSKWFVEKSLKQWGEKSECETNYCAEIKSTFHSTCLRLHQLNSNKFPGENFVVQRKFSVNCRNFSSTIVKTKNFTSQTLLTNTQSAAGDFCENWKLKFSQHKWTFHTRPTARRDEKAKKGLDGRTRKPERAGGKLKIVYEMEKFVLLALHNFQIQNCVYSSSTRSAPGKRVFTALIGEAHTQL